MILNQYLELDFNNIQSFNEKFDVILSMEVIYYLNDKLINHVLIIF